MDYTPNNDPNNQPQGGQSGGGQPPAGNQGGAYQPPSDYPQHGQQQDYGGQYGAPPPPPPPPQQKKGGFNWLLCCGITCGVMLVIAAIAGYMMYSAGTKFMGWAEDMADMGSEVKETDSGSIRSQAQEVSVDELVNNSSAYKDQWVRVSGQLTSDIEIMGQVQPAQNQNMNNEGTAYGLDRKLLIVDVGNTQGIAYGDNVVVYGQVKTFNMSEMPFFGGLMDKVMEEAAKEDPTLQPGELKMLFVFTKDIDQSQGLAPAEEDEPVGDASGWE